MKLKMRPGHHTGLNFFGFGDKQHCVFAALYLTTSLVYIGTLGNLGGQLKEWNFSHWNATGLALGMIIVFRMLVTLAGEMISHQWVSQSRKKLIHKILQQFPILRLQFSHSKLTHKISEEFPILVSLIWSSGLEALSQSLIIVFVTFNIFKLSPSLALCLLALTILVGALSFSLKRFLRKWVTRRQFFEQEVFGLEQSLLIGFDHLSITNKIKDKIHLYESRLDSLRSQEMKISALNGSSSALSWGLKFAVLTLLMTSFFRFTSPQTLYWSFLLIGGVTQWVWAFQSLVTAQVHYENCRPLFEDHETQDKRNFTNELAVKAVDLKVYYSPVLPISRLPALNFNWSEGDRVWVQGESGIGKSTLIKSLLGLHHNWSGKIEVPHFKNFIPGYVSQSPWLDPELSLKENLGFTERTADLELLIRDLGLGDLLTPTIENNCPGSLALNPSKGQITRLAILRELIKKPSLLIVDEPTASLDQSLSKKVVQTLKKYMAGRILIVCEHNENLKSYLNPTQTLNLSPFFQPSDPATLRWTEV